MDRDRVYILDILDLPALITMLELLVAREKD